jgi:hypothetical protein
VNFNDLLTRENIDPAHVLVFRHRPHEPGLNRVLPWLAAERPEVFNAYQQTQGARLEKTMARMAGVGHVASFIGHHPGKALFVGLYSIDGARPLTFDEFWRVPAYVEMKEHGLKGWTKEDGRTEVLWFDLTPREVYAHWKGKLTVGWPPPERSWWRRAHRNEFPVLAILEDSELDAAMPDWDRIDLRWQELSALPAHWRRVLSQWRAIYYIFDTSDGRGYVGSAYGSDNLLGRWRNYAANGHGENRLLRGRDPKSFRFSILQRVSPDTEAAEVVRLEASWKDRLHTRSPWGLNDN